MATSGIPRVLMLSRVSGTPPTAILDGTRPTVQEQGAVQGFHRDGLRSPAARGAAPGGTALEAGFADQAHFTRTVKAAFGMTPGRYVRLCVAHAVLQRQRRAEVSPGPGSAAVTG